MSEREACSPVHIIIFISHIFSIFINKAPAKHITSYPQHTDNIHIMADPFTSYTTKLQSDQSLHRQRIRTNASRLENLSSISARRARDERKMRMEERRLREEEESKRLNVVRRYYECMERRLGVVSDLGEGFDGKTLQLKANSVYGEGDKISLPPSLLERLAMKEWMGHDPNGGQPLFFRLGIRRDGYVFPSSPLLRSMMESADVTVDGIRDEAKDEQDDEEEEYDDDTIIDKTQAYREELKHQYVSYAYATVVEFTEEEGYVGLPRAIADRLLNPLLNGNNEKDIIGSRFNVDPSAVSNMDEHINGEMEDKTYKEQHTPGHPAYGLFPIPSSSIDISLITKLPIGNRAVLIPTYDAIKNGFYDLKNIKEVLEQSLIRTRAGLVIGDKVATWFRGRRFELQVKDVMPGEYGAVSLINTDVLVDIDAVDKDEKDQGGKVHEDMNGYRLGSASESTVGFASTGHHLTDPTDDGPSKANALSSQSKTYNSTVPNVKHNTLLTEPPLHITDNVITIQIHGNEGQTSRRRRFDTERSTVSHLFVFACLEGMVKYDSNENDDNLDSKKFRFRLVSRFPRRVLDYNVDGEKSLRDAGLQGGQELFFIE